MPLPPLAASERRLAQLASVFFWVCFFLGCVAAGASFGFHNIPAGERLFAAVAGAGLFGIGGSLRRTAASPRDDRQGFAPVLVLFSFSAIVLFIAWRREPSANVLGQAALVSALLCALLGWIYVRAAPGVNLGAVIAPPADAPAKAVQLGVRVAPAPIPEPAATEAAPEPKAASGASRG